MLQPAANSQPPLLALRCSGKKLWGYEGGGSGLGSTLNYTANVRQQLLTVLSRYNISSMLDSSCGSMHWMPLVLQEREKSKPDFRFMGTDVVCNLISNHTVNFAAHKNWNFKVRWGVQLGGRVLSLGPGCSCWGLQLAVGCLCTKRIECSPCGRHFLRQLWKSFVNKHLPGPQPADGLQH